MEKKLVRGWYVGAFLVLVVILIGIGSIVTTIANIATPVPVSAPNANEETITILFIDSRTGEWGLNVNQNLTEDKGVMPDYRKTETCSGWADSQAAKLNIEFTNDFKYALSTTDLSQYQTAIFILENGDVLHVTQLSNGNLGYKITEVNEKLCGE